MTTFDQRTFNVFRGSADAAIASGSPESIERAREDCAGIIEAVSKSVLTFRASKQEAIDESHPPAFAEGLDLLAESQSALLDGLQEIAEDLDLKIAT